MCYFLKNIVHTIFLISKVALNAMSRGRVDAKYLFEMGGKTKTLNSLESCPTVIWRLMELKLATITEYRYGCSDCCISISGHMRLQFFLIDILRCKKCQECVLIYIFLSKI